MFDQWGFQCESTLATRTPFSKDMHHGNGDKLTVRLNTQNEWGYSLTCGRFYTTPQNKCLFYCYASDVQCRRYFLISKQIARKGHTLFFCFIVFTPHQFFFLCCFELQQLFFFQGVKYSGTFTMEFQKCLFVFSVIDQGLGRQNFSSKSKLVSELLILMKFEEFSTKIQTFH